MYFNNDLGLGFLVNAKTASQSIVEMFRRRNEEFRFGLVEGTNHHFAYYVEDASFFTLVRNHWDAIASWVYYCRLENPISANKLDRFVLAHPQYFGCYPQSHGYRSDIPAMWRFLGTLYEPDVLRYEELPGGLEEYFKKWKLPAPDLQIVNYRGRGKKHYSEVLQPDAVQYVWNRWGEEIEELGYTFEGR